MDSDLRRLEEVLDYVCYHFDAGTDDSGIQSGFSHRFPLSSRHFSFITLASAGSSLLLLMLAAVRAKMYHNPYFILINTRFARSRSTRLK
jgi:hypothetical protein